MTQHLRLSPEQFNRIKGKRSKYGNKKKEVAGRTFDSGREAKRYQELLALQAGKLISMLVCQVPIACVVNRIHVCDYVCDFKYLDVLGHEVVEDVKGKRTDVYMLKRKLVRACHGIEILET